MPAAKKPAHHHSDKAKLDFVKTYLILNKNLALTARTCGIPYPTAQDWKASSWWEGLEQQLLVKDTIELSSRLKKVIDLSSAAVIDRLEKGDYFYDQKTGQVKRKPVSMKDAQQVFKETMDMKSAVEEKPKREEEEQTIKQTLLQLARNFEELVQKQKEKPVVQVTDVLFVEEKDNV